MAAIPFKQDIYYPESDGRPMGETAVHVEEIFELYGALGRRYRGSADVLVGADMLMYYVQGSPGDCVCPDVFVTFGIPKEPKRRSYFLWKEGRPPSLVIEVTSESSRKDDLEKKKKVYARIGVQEYFLADPLSEYLSPPLQGFRLFNGDYRPIKPAADGSLLSETTGLRFCREGQRVRLIDAATGEPLLWAAEQATALEERNRALRAAEEEIARLRRELEERGREG
jgi:Uma2 family endonuclease